MYTCKDCYHYNDCNEKVGFDIGIIPAKNCVTFINKDNVIIIKKEDENEI